jgi:hypothetical protein
MAVIILGRGNHTSLLSVFINLASEVLGRMIANVEVVLPQGLANLVDGLLFRIGRNLGSASGGTLLGENPEFARAAKRR